MDKRWLKTSLTVSVIVVMVLLLYLVNYLFSDDDSVEKNNQDKKIVENTIKLDSNSDEAKLNRYVIAFNSNCANISLLYKNKLGSNDIDSNIKITTVLNFFLSENKLSKTKNGYILNDTNMEDIKKLYFQIFNEEVDISKTMGNCPKIKKINNSYYIDDCICDINSKVAIHFKRSIKDEDSIKLYYKVAFYSQRSYLGNKKDVISKDPRGVYEIYKKAITGKKFDYQGYLDNNLEKFNEYEFTFKKKNDNYYFYSIRR